MIWLGTQALEGKDGFLTKLANYDKRNDPTVQGQSHLSQYLHFGHLAPQRAALEALKHKKKHKVRVFDWYCRPP